MGDFNTPHFDWKDGLSQDNCHYYSKLKEDVIYTSSCLFDLRQRIDAIGSSSLLDLAFTNFNELNINFFDSGIIKPDAYHLLLLFTSSCTLTLVHAIMNIPTANFHLGITLCYVTFSQLKIGFLCTVSSLLMMLSPASTLLS
jgi:hypothetical protein